MDNHYAFNPGDRVVVVEEEPDAKIREQGGAIPVGTTGVVLRQSGECENPSTHRYEDYFSVMLDIPYTGCSWHTEREGKTVFDLFASMLELLDEAIPVLDMDGIFDD